MALVDVFQHIYIINLPSRPDRRREMVLELSRIGISADNPSVTFFPAVRPEDAAGFPGIGARGCFLSHLSVLRDAQERRLDRILIAEDDLAFAKDFARRIDALASDLTGERWDIFYGGYRLPRSRNMPGAGLLRVSAEEGIQTTPMTGFQGHVIGAMANFLETILSRQPGDPLGGPMHVDGAYSTFRRQNPEIVTLAAVPPLGFQRSSRSDISPNAWYDKVPLLRGGAHFLRQIKNVSN